jgi:uncharacterized membrane protein YciS (DUF1049 family)
MKPAVLVGFALFLIGAALFLAQLWAQPFAPETFLKLIVTDGVLLGVLIVGAFLLRERAASERLRRGKDLD